jgi:putative tricarboxylic transport membrane protein
MQSAATIARLAALSAGLAVAALAAPAAAQDWKPSKNVEIVVGSAPGGAPDVMARLVQSLFQNKGFGPSATVVNKPGGANTVGWAYLNQHAGDAHFIATYSPTLLGNRIMGTTQLSYVDFTPLNILAREYVAFAVKADSPITSVKDLMARLKQDPTSVSFSFATARGNHNHIVIGMAIKAAGGDPRTAKAVVYPGGGPALTAMLGGHVDINASGPRSLVPLHKEGRARILAISAPERQPGPLAEFPTFREMGMDAVFFTWRGFMAPRGLKPAEIAYWDGIFAKLAQSEEWKADTEKQLWDSRFLLSADTRKHLERENEVVRGILTDLGLAKQ